MLKVDYPKPKYIAVCNSILQFRLRISLGQNKFLCIYGIYASKFAFNGGQRENIGHSVFCLTLHSWAFKAVR